MLHIGGLPEEDGLILGQSRHPLHPLGPFHLLLPTLLLLQVGGSDVLGEGTLLLLEVFGVVLFDPLVLGPTVHAYGNILFAFEVGGPALSTEHRL